MNASTISRHALQARLAPLALGLLALWAASARAQTTAPDTALSGVTVIENPDATTEDSGSYAARNATVAGKTVQPLKEIPNSVSVLTRQRISDQDMTTIQDALLYVTGVEAIDYGDGTSYFKARGNYLGTEFDGVSIASGLQYLQQFDLAMYDRVEVFRGPSTVMDGAGDPGGTVNLVRKRPLDSFHAASEAQFGTFGSARLMGDITGPLTRDGSLRGRAVVVGSDALQSLDGKREQEFMAYGALDQTLSPRTTLSLSAGYQSNPVSGLDYGIGSTPEGTALPASPSQNFSPSWNRSETALAEANLNLTHRFVNGWTSQTTAFYRHELVKAAYAYSGPYVSDAGLAFYGDQSQRNGYDWFGVDSNASGAVHFLGRAHTLTVGANYSLVSYSQRSGFVSLNGPYDQGTYSVFDPGAVPQVDVPYTFYSRNRIEQYGLYAQARLRLAQPLTLVLGARDTFFKEQSESVLPAGTGWTDSARANGRFIPSAGLVYDVVPWLTAYASYARLFTPQTQTTYTGAGLPPRTGAQYETGLKGSFLRGRLSATAALFRIDDNNRAVGDPDHPTGSIAGGKARNQGLELELTGQPLPDWNVYAGYTLLNVRYENDSPDLTDGTDPKHLFKLWNTYRFSHGPLDGLMLGGGMLAQSAIYRAVKQGDYAIFNATAGYRLNRHLDLSLALNNLFDRKYYIRPPGTFYSEFGDRRNAMLTLRAQF